MNRRPLEKYAPQARREFIQAVTDRALLFGIRPPAPGSTTATIEPVMVQGDVAIIAGRPFPRKVAEQRRRLEDRIMRNGFEGTMEAIAYSWFNRLVAIRYMELHGYLDHGYRVLSHPEGKPFPEILDNAADLDLPGLDRKKTTAMLLDGTKEQELYRIILVAQCNALHKAMPFLFERIDDETELLLPDNLLYSDSIVRKLVESIEEEDWREVEIIGWLYQFYISEKKAEVIGKVVRSEDIPAATQLFTPNWIVKYLVQNSIGRQWIATYPDSPLREKMEYYIEPAEQTPEVQEQLRAITPESLNPEELTLLDPACGSGHILVEAYELFKAIYQERGYRGKDIPRLILTKNLYGLEIDDRAAQLAGFALLMKARADDRTILRDGVQPRVLSIQESQGLKAREITEALNQPIAMVETGLEQRTLFREMDEAETPLFSRGNVAVAGSVDEKDIAELLGVFTGAKTYGSLIQVTDWLVEKLPIIAQRAQEVMEHGELFEREMARSIMPILEQATLLAGRYDAVVANPPYMGSKHYNPNLKLFIRSLYKDEGADLYGCFIHKNKLLTKTNGYIAMITTPNWMFLPGFEELRVKIVASCTIDSLIHNGRGVFGSDFGSSSFALRNFSIPSYKASYKRLFRKQGSVSTNSELRQRFLDKGTYIASQKSFLLIPGSPIAYWITESVAKAFNGTRLNDIAEIKAGIGTSDNDRFLRLWHEVNNLGIEFHATSTQDFQKTNKKWLPYNKGGKFRKWYGNNEYIINWENDGAEIKHAVVNNPSDPNTTHWSRRIFNTDFFFLPSVTWSDISVSSLSARKNDKGFIHDAVGIGAYSIASEDEELKVLAILNSRIARIFTEILCPTVHFKPGQMGEIPIIPTKKSLSHSTLECVHIAKDDWDSVETSWGFSNLPALTIDASTLKDAIAGWDELRLRRIRRMVDLEEFQNKILIQTYNLEELLSSEVTQDQITLNYPNREEDIKRLISYAIGCMMGRYSLDMPGLVYAQSGNKGFDPSNYTTFPADADGIIPLTEAEWFDDDTANRFITFVATAWPKEGLEENLAFVAESLAPGKGDDPRQTIRRYMATGFFKHHLSMYKRRPIYWLFTSGKLRAFQCLVYLHRYNEGTLSRMRTEYVIPLQGKIDARIETLKEDISKATSTSHRRKLEKERDLLVKQGAELQTFDEKLRHYADMRIALDLDDGVKVNYGKFGDLLADVKAITGSRED